MTVVKDLKKALKKSSNESTTSPSVHKATSNTRQTRRSAVNLSNPRRSIGPSPLIPSPSPPKTKGFGPLKRIVSRSSICDMSTATKPTLSHVKPKLSRLLPKNNVHASHSEPAFKPLQDSIPGNKDRSKVNHSHKPSRPFSFRKASAPELMDKLKGNATKPVLEREDKNKQYKGQNDKMDGWTEFLGKVHFYHVPAQSEPNLAVASEYQVDAGSGMEKKRITKSSTFPALGVSGDNSVLEANLSSSTTAPSHLNFPSQFVPGKGRIKAQRTILVPKVATTAEDPLLNVPNASRSSHVNTLHNSSMPASEILNAPPAPFISLLADTSTHSYLNFPAPNSVTKSANFLDGPPTNCSSLSTNTLVLKDNNKNQYSTRESFKSSKLMRKGRVFRESSISKAEDNPVGVPVPTTDSTPRKTDDRIVSLTQAKPSSFPPLPFPIPLSQSFTQTDIGKEINKDVGGISNQSLPPDFVSLAGSSVSDHCLNFDRQAIFQEGDKPLPSIPLELLDPIPSLIETSSESHTTICSFQDGNPTTTHTMSSIDHYPHLDIVTDTATLEEGKSFVVSVSTTNDSVIVTVSNTNSSAAIPEVDDQYGVDQICALERDLVKSCQLSLLSDSHAKMIDKSTLADEPVSENTHKDMASSAPLDISSLSFGQLLPENELNMSSISSSALQPINQTSTIMTTQNINELIPTREEKTSFTEDDSPASFNDTVEYVEVASVDSEMADPVRVKAFHEYLETTLELYNELMRRGKAHPKPKGDAIYGVYRPVTMRFIAGKPEKATKVVPLLRSSEECQVKSTQDSKSTLASDLGTAEGVMRNLPNSGKLNYSSSSPGDPFKLCDATSPVALSTRHEFIQKNDPMSLDFPNEMVTKLKSVKSDTSSENKEAVSLVRKRSIVNEERSPPSQAMSEATQIVAPIVNKILNTELAAPITADINRTDNSIDSKPGTPDRKPIQILQDPASRTLSSESKELNGTGMSRPHETDTIIRDESLKPKDTVTSSITLYSKDRVFDNSEIATPSRRSGSAPHTFIPAVASEDAKKHQMPSSRIKTFNIYQKSPESLVPYHYNFNATETSPRLNTLGLINDDIQSDNAPKVACEFFSNTPSVKDSICIPAIHDIDDIGVIDPSSEPLQPQTTSTPTNTFYSASTIGSDLFIHTPQEELNDTFHTSLAELQKELKIWKTLCLKAFARGFLGPDDRIGIEVIQTCFSSAYPDVGEELATLREDNRKLREQLELARDDNIRQKEKLSTLESVIMASSQISTPSKSSRSQPSSRHNSPFDTRQPCFSPKPSYACDQSVRSDITSSTRHLLAEISQLRQELIASRRENEILKNLMENNYNAHSQNQDKWLSIQFMLGKLIETTNSSHTLAEEQKMVIEKIHEDLKKRESTENTEKESWNLKMLSMEDQMRDIGKMSCLLQSCLDEIGKLRDDRSTPQSQRTFNMQTRSNYSSHSPTPTRVSLGRHHVVPGTDIDRDVYCNTVRLFHVPSSSNEVSRKSPVYNFRHCQVI
nr:hypothetical protein L204_03311 [Cryptococcus depauperatus CBS 7855]